MRKPTTEGGPDRLLALSDGVFAIAITLLVLDIHVPQGLDSDGFHQALGDVVPNLGAYAISLAVLAGFWRDHRAIFHRVRLVDADVIGLTVLGLGLAALLPFPTALVSEYGDETTSVVIYSAAVASSAPSTSPSPSSSPARPWLHGDAEPLRNEFLYAVDLGVMVGVFVVTIPLALLVGLTAMWWWLVQVPVKVWLGRKDDAAAK